MQHHVIVKFNETVKDKIALANEIGNLFKGMVITDACIGCGTCQNVCPQNVIVEGSPFVIDAHHCLQCGNCAENCPVQAIERL